jgi:hypothetical protein
MRFKLFKKPSKKNIFAQTLALKRSNSLLTKKILILTILVVFFIVAGLFSLQKTISKNILIPEVSIPPQLSSEKVVFKSEKNFVTELDGDYIKATKEADNLFIVTVPNKDKTYNYKLYGLQSNKVFSIKSEKFQTGSFETDFTPPDIQLNKIDDIYNQKDIKIQLVTNEEVKTSINDKHVECNLDKSVFTCSYEFEKEGNQELSFKFEDKAGNKTEKISNVLYTPLPKITCDNQIPERTNLIELILNCTVNKEGKVLYQNKEYQTSVNTPFEIKAQLTEGANNVDILFQDTYKLESTFTAKTIRDTQAPTANFTFLDVKKIYQQGTVGIAFTSSENATASVRFYPVNSLFQVNSAARELLENKAFTYEGGQSFEQKVEMNKNSAFSTPNNFAICLNLSLNNKNCLSPGIIAIDITLVDDLGNKRVYTCNNWIATDTAKLEGLEATTCLEK